MVKVPCSILGGLPVIADVWFSGPDYFGEYDAGCDKLFWQKRDGSCGKEISQKIYDRLDKYDSYWEASITEQANDWLSENTPTKYKTHTVGEYSPEYLLLNR